MGLMGKRAYLGVQWGEYTAVKGISCDSISVLIHFSVISYIIYHGIDNYVILALVSEHFSCIFPQLVRNCMLKIRNVSKSPIC